MAKNTVAHCSPHADEVAELALRARILDLALDGLRARTDQDQSPLPAETIALASFSAVLADRLAALYSDMVKGGKAEVA